MKATEKQKEYFKQYYLKNRDKKLKYAKEYKLKNPGLFKKYIDNIGYENFAKIQRKSFLKRTYNLTLEQYEQKLKEQNYCCAICNRHQSKFKRKLAVDHDHKTGKIRDLLCAGCNVDISVVEDRLEILLKYLNKHRKELN
jgi:hypothetical protein